MSTDTPLPCAGSNDQVSEILLNSKRTIPGASQLSWSLRFVLLYSPPCKHKSIIFYWVWGPDSLWEPGFLAYHSCVFWQCSSPRAQLLLAMWGQGWRWVQVCVSTKARLGLYFLLKELQMLQSTHSVSLLLLDSCPHQQLEILQRLQ